MKGDYSTVLYSTVLVHCNPYDLTVFFTTLPYVDTCTIYSSYTYDYTYSNSYDYTYKRLFGGDAVQCEQQGFGVLT